MDWLGDYAEDATTVVCMFTTHDGNGAPVAPSDAFEAADVLIYKNGSNAQKTTTNGVTMTSPFDSLTGLHCVVIDTSNDTGDGGFWVAGGLYTLVLSPDSETVNAQTVRKVIGQFGIELRLNAATTLNLKKLNAVNSTGDAVNFESTGGNGKGLRTVGHGTGDGWETTGGATANGFEAIGGTTSGSGTYSRAAADGYGMRLEAVDNGVSGERAGLYAKGSNTTGGSGAHFDGGEGGAAGDGLVCESHDDGTALVLQATDGTGNCLYMNGQGSSGHPFLIRAGANAHAAYWQGAGSGAAFALQAGPTGDALRVIAGATSGDGVRITTTSGEGIDLSGASSTGFDATTMQELADAFLNRDMSLGTDSGSTTFRTPRQAFRFLRNKWDLSGGTLTVTKEDDTTASWTAVVTGTAGANPVTAVDPAGP